MTRDNRKVFNVRKRKVIIKGFVNELLGYTTVVYVYKRNRSHKR